MGPEGVRAYTSEQSCGQRSSQRQEAQAGQQALHSLTASESEIRMNRPRKAEFARL